MEGEMDREKRIREVTPLNPAHYIPPTFILWRHPSTYCMHTPFALFIHPWSYSPYTPPLIVHLFIDLPFPTDLCGCSGWWSCLQFLPIFGRRTRSY